MRRLIQVTSFLTLLLAVTHAGAQPAYPTKPIRVINGDPLGSPSDVLMRIVAVPLAALLGQPVLVENRPGAINTIGLAAVAKSEPDGHTLGVMPMPSTVAPSLLPQIPFDTARDLAPVRQLSWASNVLVVRAESRVTSIENLVATAKAEPERLTFASGGNASPAHLSGELFRLAANIQIRHVPFKGAVAGVTAVIGEQVDMMFATVPSVIAHIKSGKLRALATPAPSRLTVLPDVPTLSELGYPVEVRGWQGVVAPAGTPKAVIARLETALATVISQKDVRERLLAVGLEPAESNAEAFGTHIRSELQKWARAVRDAGIRAD